MEIQIETSLEHYKSLLSRVQAASSAYPVLTNKVTLRRSPDVVVIVCKERQAKSLLRAAKRLCPNAALDIEEGIIFSRFCSRRRLTSSSP